MGASVALDGAREISAGEIHGRHRRSDERHRRVKNFEEDDSIARETDIISPTDGKPLRETLRGYKSQDGEFMLYKVIGGRKMEETEVKQLVERARSVRSTGSFRPRPAPNVAAALSWSRMRETGSGKTESTSATNSISTRSIFWTDPNTGGEFCEVGRTTFYANATLGNGNKLPGSRLMCQKPIPPEQALKLRRRKDRFDQRFHLKKGPAL